MVVDSTVLPPFHNISYSSISHIHIDVNKSRHIYLSRFININMNVGNARMTYIIKRRNYIVCIRNRYNILLKIMIYRVIYIIDSKIHYSLDKYKILIILI